MKMYERMEVSGQLHITAALLPGTSPQCLLDRNRRKLNDETVDLGSLKLNTKQGFQCML
jgi:hypothetical protein